MSAPLAYGAPTQSHAGGAGGGGGGGVTSVTAGAGLTGGGVGAVTLNVVGNADGSIVANANDIQVGVLATDGQHGTRGGGSLHALAIAAGAAGFLSGADKSKLDGIGVGAAVVSVGAGAGLVNSGSATVVVIDVVANADGSIVANANDIQVGVLATDAQHGNRGGGAVHANVVAAGAAGFMTGADKTKLDGIGVGAAVVSVAGGAGMVNSGSASVVVLDVVATNTSITVNANDLQLNEAYSPTWTGTHIWNTADAGTTTTTRPKLAQHRSSGAPAAGFGVGQEFKLDSSTNQLRTAGQLDVVWTDASNTSEIAEARIFLRNLNGLAATNSALPTTATWALNGGTGQTTFITDTVNNNLTTMLTLEHRLGSTATAAAASFGVRLLFNGEDASRNADNLASMDASWTTATSGSESSKIIFTVRNAGGALASALQIAPGAITHAGGFGVYQGTSGTASLDTTGAGTVSLRPFGTAIILVRGGSGIASGLEITPQAATNSTLSTERSDWLYTANTRQFATGALTTNRYAQWTATTYSFVGASTLTNSIYMSINAAPTAGTNATFTNSIALRVGGDVSLGPTSAGMTYSAYEMPAHTVTVTGSTQVTAASMASGLRLGIITVTDASAVTVDRAATLYIAGAPAAAGSVTLTNAYALWVDAGGSRFDGNVGFFATEPQAQQTGGQNVTNNVVDSGSTNGTIPDFTDNVVWANDALNVRRALFQMARMLKQDHDALRLFGFLT